MRSLRKKSSFRRKNLYNSIYVLPLYNWDKMRANDDYSYLLRDPKRHKEELADSQKIQLHGLYLSLITEFFEEFGQSKSYIDELKIKSKLIDKRIDFVKTGDVFKLNDIEMIEDKLIKLRLKNIDQTAGVDQAKEMKRSIAKVGRDLGRTVDTKTITVVRFYTQLLSA